jgi:SAM-dependent methyltransferase
MLNRVWQKQLAASVIDCHYDEASDTISACDTSGLVIVVDSDAVTHSQIKVSMPAWGVAHILDKSGDPLIAVAEARKANGSGVSEGGALTVASESGVRMHARIRAPCWDVALVSGSIWCSSWGGEIFQAALEPTPEEGMHPVAVDGQAYGLAPADDPHGGGAKLLACVAGRGVIALDPDSRVVSGVVLRAPTAAYNVITRGLTTVAGSTDRGMVIVNAAGERSGIRSLPLGGQVSALALVADEFFVAGDLDGSVALFHLSRLDRPLAGMTLPGGVWNLSSDSRTGRVYAACGDGHLYALELSLDADLSKRRVESLRHATRSPLTLGTLMDATTSLIEISIALAEVDAAWSDYSSADLQVLATALKRWSAEYPSARVSYRLGMVELEREKWDDAIVALQQIDQTSDTYAASLLPLADAFDHIGSTRTAVNVLKANLDRFPATALLEVLFKVGQLSENSGDLEGALTAYEAVSFHDHSYPGVRDVLARLRPASTSGLARSEPSAEMHHTLDVSEDTPTRLGSRRRLAYDQISYIQYEYGPPADEAKKLLEEHEMAGVLSRQFSESGRSLDIGCATGRWPIWFSRRGWTATGYDISEHAIEICERRAQQMPPEQRPLAFRRHDICEGALEVEMFDLVSTMMGTFNHIPHELLSSFLQGIWDSLRPGGTLIFTSWNAQSRFCDFLNLDGERAKESMRRNSLQEHEIAGRLAEADFEGISMVPIVFLPNACYDVWEDDLGNPAESFIKLDEVLRQHVAVNKAQMHFYSVNKPRL